jgi:hypothetical protein
MEEITSLITGETFTITWREDEQASYEIIRAESTYEFRRAVRRNHRASKSVTREYEAVNAFL